MPSEEEVEADAPNPEACSGALATAEGGGDGGLLERQHASPVARTPGDYSLTFVPTRAGFFTLTVHIRDANGGKGDDDEPVCLGPWRLVVGPSTLCLNTSLAAAMLPMGALEVGSGLRVIMPLLDRFSNVLLLPSTATTVLGHSAAASPAPRRGEVWGATTTAPFAGGLHAWLVRATAAAEAPEAEPSAVEVSCDAMAPSAPPAEAERVPCALELLRDAPPHRSFDALLAEHLQQHVKVKPARPSTAAADRGGTSSDAVRRPGTAGPNLRRAAGAALGAHALSASLQRDATPSFAAAVAMATGDGAAPAQPPPTGADALAWATWRAKALATAMATAGAVAAATDGVGVDSAASANQMTPAFARVSLDSIPCGEWLLRLNSGAPAKLGLRKGEADAQHAAVSSAKIVARAGALDATRCRASGPGILSAHVGQPAEFTLTPCDANGYAKRVSRGAPFRLSVLNSGAHNGRRLDFRVDARSDGSYLVRYVPFGAAGDFLLQVTFAGRPIAGSPFRVAVADMSGNARAQLRQRPATAPALTATQRRNHYAKNAGIGHRPHSRAAAHGMAEGERSLLLGLAKKTVVGPGQEEALLARLQLMRAPQQRQHAQPEPQR